MRYAQVVVNTPLAVKVLRNIEQPPDESSVEPAPLDELSRGSIVIDRTSKLPIEPKHLKASFDSDNEVTEESDTPDESSRNRTFTYAIAEPLANKILLGQLVWIPFGSRRLQGVIVGFSDTSPVPTEKVKDIDEIAEPRPFLNQARIDLARWISQTYLYSFNNAIQLMLPPGVDQSPEVLVSLIPDAPHADLTEKQTALVDLLDREGEKKLRELPEEYRSSIDGLVRRNILSKKTITPAPRAKPKHIKAVRLIADKSKADALIGNIKHASVVERLDAIVNFLRHENTSVWVSAIYAAIDTSSIGDLKRLDDLGIVALEEEEVVRDSLAGRVFDVVEPPKLTPDQERVWNEIAMSHLHLRAVQVLRETQATKLSPTQDLDIMQHAPRNTFLLHGVTGSGKTEIYLRAIAETLKQGKQAIILVPEISLTPQTIRRFGARFPNQIAVLHSNLGIGERYDTWRRCRDGKVNIVIGPRSALFAPLPNLGLIVLDEEHDPAFKQESPPYYHARDVAIELAQRVGATVILGSATPDLETYYRAVRGEITLLEMPKRIMGHAEVIKQEIAEYQLPDSKLVVHSVGESYADARYIDLPPVDIVDLRAELKAGNLSMFSRALQREMTRVLAAHEQIILFLNRRGTATFILCRDCGYVMKCKRCDNPLTFHGEGNELVCHHCNRRDKVPTICPNCRSARIRFFGAGTQKIDEEIQKMFPQARTLRWDVDVTKGKESHEAILQKFINHQADILIGTQMIAKGLDLPLVTLVGVISADTALNLPDFRASERTFQLMTQVAGRAGRSILGGKVIVQTYNPEHYAIVAASQHDYQKFYEREIQFRREQKYPPFERLVRLLFAHASERTAQSEAARLHRLLMQRIAQRGLPGIDLIGPVPAFFRRERGKYRYQILVRGDAPHALIGDMELPIGWRIDVDPVDVL
jgi:primosomal protein N' (replication factor Y)